MKKKIVGIFFCTLLICTIFSVSGQVCVEKNVKNIGKTSLGDDVPNWEVGYSWTYTGEADFSYNDFFIDLNLNEACFCVVDDSGGMYNMAFGGDITGSFGLFSLNLSFEFTELTGNVLLTQSNLDYKEIDIAISGSCVYPPLNLPADGSINIGFDTVIGAYDFPLEEGKFWIIPSTGISLDMEIVFLGSIKESWHFDLTTEEIYSECVGMEVVSAGGKTYNSYNISYGGGNLYYAPSVGNWVLLTTITDDFNVELIATSYPSPDNPLKPETPSGETNGKTGKTYEYTTKAVDPNGDQIKYAWDWDGDMIPDELTGLYNSDVTITTEHAWDKDGTYYIRVRARDTTGLESEWSDPLTVTMPRNRAYINRPLLNFLQYHPYLFPLLRLLLQR
jgi:hypothetical protein